MFLDSWWWRRWISGRRWTPGRRWIPVLVLGTRMMSRLRRHLLVLAMVRQLLALVSWRTGNMRRQQPPDAKRWGRASMMSGSSQRPCLVSPVHRMEKEWLLDRAAEMIPLI